jgi:hypothetical protein
MKKLKSIFCHAFNDYKGTEIYHIDEITHATFKGRELFNFCELYAGRAEYAYGKKHRRIAFAKGLLIGLVIGVIVYFLK